MKFSEFPTIYKLDTGYNIKQMGTSCVFDIARHSTKFGSAQNKQQTLQRHGNEATIDVFLVWKIMTLDRH